MQRSCGEGITWVFTGDSALDAAIAGAEKKEYTTPRILEIIYDREEWTLLGLFEKLFYKHVLKKPVPVPEAEQEMREMKAKDAKGKGEDGGDDDDKEGQNGQNGHLSSSKSKETIQVVRFSLSLSLSLSIFLVLRIF